MLSTKSLSMGFVSFAFVMSLMANQAFADKRSCETGDDGKINHIYVPYIKPVFLNKSADPKMAFKQCNSNDCSQFSWIGSDQGYLKSELQKTHKTLERFGFANAIGAELTMPAAGAIGGAVGGCVVGTVGCVVTGAIGAGAGVAAGSVATYTSVRSMYHLEEALNEDTLSGKAIEDCRPFNKLAKELKTALDLNNEFKIHGYRKELDYWHAVSIPSLNISGKVKSLVNGTETKMPHQSEHIISTPVFDTGDSTLRATN